MITNKPYWQDKNNRAIQAKEHTKEMDKIVVKPTNIIYGYPDSMPVPKVYNIKEEIKALHSLYMCENTISGFLKIYQDYSQYNICILNFASYKNAGGGFLQGSMAQEESICHSSNLFNTLRTCNNYYEWNRNNLNNALYTNRAIYSKDVTICDGAKEILTNVLTCASPNYGASSKYCHITKEENDKVLKDRIEFIRNILLENQVDIAILGAFGCGVFRQDAFTVANLFKEIFNDTCPIIPIYAVPSGIHNENMKAFKQVFGEKK